MKALGGAYPRFRAFGTQVLGVSVDDRATQGRFALHCATPFPLLSDPGGKVAGKYRSRWFGLSIAERVTFVLDGQGRIRQVVEGMPDPEVLLSTVASLTASTSPSTAPARQP